MKNKKKAIDIMEFYNSIESLATMAPNGDILRPLCPYVLTEDADWMVSFPSYPILVPNTLTADPFKGREKYHSQDYAFNKFGSLALPRWPFRRCGSTAEESTVPAGTRPRSLGNSHYSKQLPLP